MAGNGFGGDWTADKLEILKEYLDPYTTALKGKFNTIYIDAFAGTGFVSPPAMDSSDEYGFFDPFAREKIEGSASIALNIRNPFDRYIFIDKSSERTNSLHELKKEHPDKEIEIIHGEANEEIQALCREDWTGQRAVLFLDPYGMQVNWNTIKAISETHGIDLWYLFPLGIGVMRLLRRDGNINDGNRKRLNEIFGTEEWHAEFYKSTSQYDLFEMIETESREATFEQIKNFLMNRLRSQFAKISECPRVLKNSKGNPLYLFCFAVSNKSEKANSLALKIANHILRKHHGK